MIIKLSCFFLLVFSACSFLPVNEPVIAFDNLFYSDIPGITEDEINAVNNLRNRVFTVYVPHSTELFFDEYGEAGGYTALLCEWLSAFFGLTFVPGIESLGNIAQSLNNGDEVFAFQAVSEERLANFYLSDPIAMRSIRLMRHRESQSINFISQTRDPRYVLLEGAMIIDLFSGNEEPVIIAQDYEEVYQILENREADAFVGNSTMEIAFDSFGGVITEDFFPLTFIPIALATGDPALNPVVSILNKALENGAYSHLVELYRRGYQDYRRHRFLLFLTEEEREYLINNPVIPFATQYMSYPLSFYNRHENLWEGAVFEVLEEMEILTGIEFLLVNNINTELPELMDLLEDGTAYIIPNLVQSDERRERFIWPHTMYISDRFALLSKRSFPNIELNDIPFARVGFARGSVFSDMFRSWFPNALYAVEYLNTDDAFMALDRGEVDLVMSSQSRLAALTNLYEFSDYKANYIFNAAYEASFGINRDHYILSSIIDKALVLIDTERIMMQWESITYDYQARLMREQQPWLLGISVLAIFVLVLVSVLLTISRSSGKKLEILVKQRTSELESEVIQRKAAESEAMASSNAKSRFLANMSHEMRTPMNVIVGITDILLEEENLDTVIKDNIIKINGAGITLLGLINDVLDISKIEADKLEIIPINYNIPSLLNDIMNLNTVRIEDKPVKFILDIKKDLLLTLNGDDLRIKQIINNLLSNAFKYTQAGIVTMGMSTEVLEKNVWVSIYVRDTGIGIRNEDLKKLFTDYSQVDTIANRNIEGTGLGLSIAKRLTEMMDGVIYAESEYGKGSVFHVRFRQSFVSSSIIGEELAHKLINFKYKEESVSAEKRINRPDLGFAKVLVVDDMQTNLDVAVGLLTKYKMQVDCVTNGHDAVEKIKSEEPIYNAIFMDHMMPGMDGIETLHNIRNIGTDYAIKIPVIALTANAIQGMEEIFYENDFQAFLSKPINIIQLDSVIRRYIDRRGDAR